MMMNPPRADYPSQARSQSRYSPLVWLLRLIILGVMGMLLLALLLAILLVGWQAALQDRIAAGVSVSGIDLSGKTRDEASAVLMTQLTALEHVSYTLRDGGREWRATAAELGLHVAVDDMLEQAFAIGHSGDGLRDLMQQADAWFSGESMAAALAFDENVALNYLLRLAPTINRERQDASLTIDGTDVQVHAGASGRKLDIPATLVRLTATMLAFPDVSEIDLVIDESPPRFWNVDEAALQVDAALSAPLQLVATDAKGRLIGPWTVTAEQIRSLLSVTLRDDDGRGKRYHAALNTEAIATFLRSLAPSLIIIPQDGTYDFDPQSGQLLALSPSTGGRELNVEKTIAGLREAVFDRDARRVPMVFDDIQARYHDQVSAAELGITELVAQSTTYYWGSWQNRRTNIAVGAGKLDGVIIAPGEEFSFNLHLGDITPEAGFVDGAVIFGGSTVTGIGGGICQVSTTMFRAAFSGGYAITERNSHGYRVGYYEYAGAGPGLDAAIWQPTSDFRFQNNTPYHLLIESEFMSAKDALQFRIYSTRHWTTVVETPIIRDVVEAPSQRFVEAGDLLPGQVRQVEYAVSGADVWVYRNVYDTGGSLVKRDQAYTHYLPWRAVFEVAPGDARLEDDED